MAVGRVIAVLRDRLLLLSLLVERFVLTLINEDYYYYYYILLLPVKQSNKKNFGELRLLSRMEINSFKKIAQRLTSQIKSLTTPMIC